MEFLVGTAVCRTKCSFCSAKSNFPISYKIRASESVVLVDVCPRPETTFGPEVAQPTTPESRTEPLKKSVDNAFAASAIGGKITAMNEGVTLVYGRPVTVTKYCRASYVRES